MPRWSQIAGETSTDPYYPKTFPDEAQVPRCLLASKCFELFVSDFHAPVLRFQMSSDGQQLQCCLYYAVCLPVRPVREFIQRPFRLSLATHIPAKEGGTCNRSCQESSNLAQVLELTWAVTAAPGPDLIAPPPRNLQLASSRLRTIPMSQVVNCRGPLCLASQKSWQSKIECRQVLFEDVTCNETSLLSITSHSELVAWNVDRRLGNRQSCIRR